MDSSTKRLTNSVNPYVLRPLLEGAGLGEDEALGTATDDEEDEEEEDEEDEEAEEDAAVQANGGDADVVSTSATLLRLFKGKRAKVLFSE